ncbi:formate transporter FocA [Thaumasiovibrio sp. DFM-14]|uniref:formate transporter FocA n=1 Tax=Thaumasiovibrio sp. DFM-14 TaxID=3384792 RepID=UPI0039A299BE
MQPTIYSDLHHLSPKEMMENAESYALGKATKSTKATIGFAMTAGVFIGLAFVFYITVTTGNVGIGWGVNRLLGGMAFSLGLILVVLCGGELFTSSVLTSIARANNEISTTKMIRIWLNVYIGNFLGAMILLALVTSAQLYKLDDGQWGYNALLIAQHKLHHEPLQAFSLGILCNMLVCLAIWMTFCSNNTLVKLVVLILPVSMFVSTGFEHSVANMFMVPLGIFIQNFAPDTFWQQIGVSAAQFSDLTIAHFLTENLIPVTLGNIVGGSVLVGLTYWALLSSKTQPLPSATILTPNFSGSQQFFEDIMMTNDNMLVRDHMESPSLTLQPEMPIVKALDVLIENDLSGAPVMTSDQRLVGFFSVHDVLVDLWCEEYMPNHERKVQDLMKSEVHTVSPENSVLEIAEYMSIDKNVLYPVSDAGIATRLSTMPLYERARTMTINRPHCYPVVEHGELVGLIARSHVIKAIRPLFGNHLNVVEADIEADIEAETKESEQLQTA